jgi:hypothetical protein
MQRTYLRVVALLIASGLTGTAAAQTVENPQYKTWSGWREGASVTMKMETALDGKVQSTVTSTQTLKKLSADKAVIEVSTVTEVSGQTIKQGPIAMDIPARAPKPPAVKPEAEPTNPTEAPKFKESKGRETLTINGKKLQCEWTQLEGEGGYVAKTWSCEDMPLGFVKSVVTVQGMKTISQVVEWKGTKK